MDIDLDWCLTCGKRADPSSLYCSADCQSLAGPSNFSEPQVHSQEDSEQYSSQGDDDEDVIFHSIDDADSRWTGNDAAGIEAWAAEIPAGAPTGRISSSCDDSSDVFSLSSTAYRPAPPNLLKSHRRVVPPSLCITTPPPALQPLSTPMVTPKRQSSMNSVAQTGQQDASLGRTSLKSAATESSLATPASSSQPMPILISANRKPSTIGEMYSQMQSWASPSPDIFVPAATQQQPRYQPPLPWVEYSKFAVLADHSAVCWKTGAQKHQQQQPPTRAHYFEPSRGRSSLTPAFSHYHDDHPSFRTRGRRASRAAA